MAGPFHHDVGRDAEGEGVNDEGAATGMGADELPLGLDFVGNLDERLDHIAYMFNVLMCKHAE